MTWTSSCASAHSTARRMSEGMVPLMALSFSGRLSRRRAMRGFFVSFSTVTVLYIGMLVSSVFVVKDLRLPPKKTVCRIHDLRVRADARCAPVHYRHFFHAMLSFPRQLETGMSLPVRWPQGVIGQKLSPHVEDSIQSACYQFPVGLGLTLKSRHPFCFKLFA